MKSGGWYALLQWLLGLFVWTEAGGEVFLGVVTPSRLGFWFAKTIKYICCCVKVLWFCGSMSGLCSGFPAKFNRRETGSSTQGSASLLDCSLLLQSHQIIKPKTDSCSGWVHPKFLKLGLPLFMFCFSFPKWWKWDLMPVFMLHESKDSRLQPGLTILWFKDFIKQKKSCELLVGQF